MLGEMRFENVPEISVFASPLAIVVAGGQRRAVGGSEMLGANRILAACDVAANSISQRVPEIQVVVVPDL